MQFLAPLDKWFVNAIEEYTLGATSILLLLFVCCPSTVAWFVITVIFDAINCVLVRAVTHVLEKISKIKPALAHADSATAIVCISCIFGVIASLLHCVPHSIYRAFRKPMNWVVSTLTPARFCMTRSKIAVSNLAPVPTLAFAQKLPLITMAFDPWKLFNHYEESK